MENNLKLNLSIDETCNVSDLSRPTIMAFIHRAENPLPHIRVGRKYIIPRAALEAWLMEEAARNTMQTGRPMVR